MAPNFRLNVRSGPTAGQILNLEKPEIFIGRDINNDVVINDSEVSRRHARLFFSENSYVVEDLGSTNGTSVNGQRITGPYLLRPGELIMLGESITMLYEYQQAYASPVPVPPQPIENVPPPRPVPPAYVPPVSTPPPPPPYVPQQQSYPPQPPQYIPPQQNYPPRPVYAPAPQPPEEEKKFPTWIILLVLFIILIICLCSVALYIIDANAMWCDFFGFLFNMVNPGTCP